MHIERANVRLYSGNYSAFEEQRAAQLAQQQAMYERQQREIRHDVQFIERFRAKASKARQAQSRLKTLERMERIAPAHVDSPFEFSFLATAKATPSAADGLRNRQQATKRAAVVLSEVNWSDRPGIELQCWDATAPASPR